MNNFDKIITLNKQLIQKKFNIFYGKQKKLHLFDRATFYQFMGLDGEKFFSIYTEYLSFIKNKIDGSLDG